MAEHVEFTREILCKGKELRIHQLYVGDVGCVVWDAALVLIKFLEHPQHFPEGYWFDRRVIELGCGTGAVGIAAGALG